MNPLDWLSAHNTCYGPILNSRAPVEGGDTEGRVIVFSVGQYPLSVNIRCAFYNRHFLYVT